jgi:hypothetical protein
MALTDRNKWVVALVMAAGSAVVFNPITFNVVETVVSKLTKKSGWIAEVDEDGSWTTCTPAVGGYVLHTIVFFFVAVAIFQYDFECV